MDHIKLIDNIKVKLDTKGNVYFYVNDNELYDVIIDRNNMIELDRYDLGNNIMDDDSENDDNNDNNDDNNNHKIRYGQLISLETNNTLKGNIIKQIDEEKEKQQNDPNADFDDYDDYNPNDDDVIKQTYFPEDRYLDEYMDKDENEYVDQYDKEGYFIFNSLKAQNRSIVTQIDDNLALYETLIYEGYPSHALPIFKTKLIDDTAIYRMIIYTNGEISFRPIGEKETQYKLVYENGQLRLINQPFAINNASNSINEEILEVD